jgi:hypothetical protein
MKTTFNDLPVGAEFSWYGTPTTDVHGWKKTGKKRYRHMEWPKCVSDDIISDLIRQGDFIVIFKNAPVTFSGIASPCCFARWIFDYE